MMKHHPFDNAKVYHTGSIHDMYEINLYIKLRQIQRMTNKVNNTDIKIIKCWLFSSLVLFSRNSIEKQRTNKIQNRVFLKKWNSFKGHLSSTINFTCVCGWLANTCFAVIEFFFFKVSALWYTCIKKKYSISFCDFRLEQQELQKALHLMLLLPILLNLLVQRLTRLTNVHCTGHRRGQGLCPLLVTPQTLWPPSTFRPNTCLISGSWEESPCCVS